ncbi:MAG: tetratricopeptide repeat protein, partial [Bradymonadaceae bacterium]
GDHEVEAAEVLKPIYEDGGEWEKLVHVYRLLIQATADPQRKLELFSQVGFIFEIRLEDPRSAFAAYVETLEVDPSDQEILGTLERLAGQLDSWNELITHIDECLENLSDYDAAAGLTLRIARIMEEELQDPSSAILRYQRVLEMDPSEDAAILALDRLYQREGHWPELAEILRARVLNTTDPDEALELRLRLGRLYQDALEDENGAIETYQTVLMDDPENQVAIMSLEQMFMAGQAVQRISDILEPYYLEKGQHSNLVAIYMQRLEMIEEPSERYDVLMLVARIYLDELQDAEHALQTYGAALFEKPDDEQVMSEIERLAGAILDWGMAAGYLAEALESPSITDDAAMNLWSRLARILDVELESYDDAEMAYHKSLEYDPGHLVALEALDRIYESQARWSDLAKIIGDRIAGTYDEIEVVDLSYRLAELFQNQLADFDQAVETYEKVLNIQPDHENALRMLEQIHEGLQAWNPLYDVLERRVELTHDPDEQAHLYSRLARIAEEMLDRRLDAVDLWTRVTELRPDDVGALGELRRLYLTEERWDDLVMILEREVELTPDPDQRLGLYESLGTIYGDYLQNEVQAQDAWQNVLLLDAEHLTALEALRDLCTRQGDYTELAGILERMIEHAQVEQERKLELWVELGEVQGDMLMQPEQAIHAWKNVLGLDPDNTLALDNLERLFLQESRWEEGAQVLELKADRSEDDLERIDLYTRIADIWENKLFERQNAGRYYEAILEIDRRNSHASQSLEAIYVEQGTEEAFSGLASLYLDQADLAENDVFERVETLRNAARIFEDHLVQPESSLVVLMSAYGVQNLDDEALVADIERLARQTGMWGEVVEHFVGILAELGETLEAASLHRTVGQWRAQELDQPDDAVYHFQRALSIDPDNVEIMSALEELYRRLAAWPELANVLRMQVDANREPEERMELWRRLGELYELQMGQIDEAIGAYQEVLNIDPTDILAMESLERAFEALGRWTELVDILGRKATATYDPEQIVDIKSRVALIWEENLEDVDQAIIAYQEVLAADQAYEPAMEALERLYTQTGGWNEVVDIYEQRLALTHEPAYQVQLYGRMAAVYETQFQDYDRAVEAYNNVLMVDVENETAIENLERLFRMLERWFELVDVLQRHIEVAEYAEQKIELFAELGRVQRDHARDAHAAVEAFVQALEIDGGQVELWRELANLYEVTSNWESSNVAYTQLVERVESEEEQLNLYHRMGQIFEGELHDDTSAEEAYNAALRRAPGHPDVLDALRGLYTRQQEWQGLIRILKQAEGSSRDLEAKAQYMCEIGSVYQEHLEDTVSALRYFETALEHDPSITGAAAPLIDVFVREQRWERAVPLLEMVIEGARDAGGDQKTLHKWHLQLALAYSHLSQVELSLQEYRNAYELEPNDMETLKGLGHLLYENEELEQSSKILQTLQFQHIDSLESHELVDVYYKLGSIRRKLGELRSAVQYFEKGLEVEQHHRPTLQAVVDTYSEQGKWEQVVDYTRWMLEAETDPTARFAHLAKIGDLLGGKLTQPERAVEAYLEALDAEPKSVVILRKLLDLYTKTKQWHEAVQILLRIIDQETDAPRAAKYYYTAAVIYRDEIDDGAEAINLFEKALDTDVKMLKAFEAVDRILTEGKDWKNLSRAYRRMLHRVSENDDGSMENIKTLLWQNLGEIYRTRLGDLKTATEAYKIAVGLNPENQALRLILAELNDKTGDNPDGAIEQHRELIKLDPFRVESYRVLFKSYIQTK